jgi:hypothetical protein
VDHGTVHGGVCGKSAHGLQLRVHGSFAPVAYPLEYNIFIEQSAFSLDTVTFETHIQRTLRIPAESLVAEVDQSGAEESSHSRMRLRQLERKTVDK